MTDEELEATLDEIRVEGPEPPPLLHEMDAAMTPEVRALVDLLREARDDLEAYVCADYPQHIRDQYPSVARQQHGDMELCRRIDAALAALRAGGAL